MAIKNQEKMLWVFVVVFLFFFLYLKTQYYYQDSLKSQEREVFDLGLDRGTSFMGGRKNVTLDENYPTIIPLGLRPGEEFRGLAVGKNSYDFNRNYQVLIESFKKDGIEDDAVQNAEKNLPVIESSLLGDNINLNPGEIVYVDYVVKVPKDIEYGQYDGLLSFASKEGKLSEGKDPETQQPMSFVILEAVGLKIKLEVSDNPRVYEYGRPINEIIKDIAKNRTISHLRNLIALIFAFFSLYALFKAYYNRIVS